MRFAWILTAFEPANHEVVGKSHDPSSCNGVVGTDVRDDIDFGSKRHIRANEFPEQRGERPTDRPESDRVEHQFVATVGIFLPTCKFVVYLRNDEISDVEEELAISEETPTVNETPSLKPPLSQAAKRVMYPLI